MRVLLSVALFVMLNRQYMVLGDCPPKWHKFCNDACVWFSDVKESWIDAYGWCHLFGGMLVEALDNDNCQSELEELLSKNTDNTVHWTGLSDMENEGNYKWMVYKFQPDPTFWAPGEPKTGDKKRCVYIDKNGSWKTDSCQNKHHFICHNSATYGKRR